jgi:hypothetical protein
MINISKPDNIGTRLAIGTRHGWDALSGKGKL